MEENKMRVITKALADKNRFEILKVITQEKKISCGEIVERFPIGQPTVSHHLKILLDAELVAVKRKGQHGIFSIRKEIVNNYCDFIKNQIGIERSEIEKKVNRKKK